MVSNLLVNLKPKLHCLLPAQLYTTLATNPDADTLMGIFEHLRTLRSILQDYLPLQIATDPPTVGKVRYSWHKGTLLFTDLAGFTPLMEANMNRQQEGAEMLLGILQSYFEAMIEIVSKSGGDLLEFTGDAVLVEFRRDRAHTDLYRAIRAGLRMQRAMTEFENIDTPNGTLSLKMRVGIHPGTFLAADIGTPERMMRVLLGKDVQLAKKTEGAGQVRQVCLSAAASIRARSQFHLKTGKSPHHFVIDDLSDKQLGEYDLALKRRRRGRALLFDRQIAGITQEIENLRGQVETLASYLPKPILKLLVENTENRQIPPEFLNSTIMFVNLLGLSDAVDRLQPSEEEDFVKGCSHLFSQINAIVTAEGGIMRNPTYHLDSSDIVIYFGILNDRPDDAIGAIRAAYKIRKLIVNFPSFLVNKQLSFIACQIGCTRGQVFAAEIGASRGRREFNLLSDTVNTAARLMSYAAKNQILFNESVNLALSDRNSLCGTPFQSQFLGNVSLKGKAKKTRIYTILEDEVCPLELRSPSNK
ncbi:MULTISPECIES: adenylate/guanylate cyclase domain-containing protein [Spirulina sp. CCY15215]|uniref:adenylate/guanylate cyclase domain-containing protein n=1 Tax=Spirulina sp. CCY15215 TaxID=2767591 RepID=UPI0019520AD3|nr:adenylate/guanylate cyclase domain-containing protein [Spirulina major]